MGGRGEGSVLLCRIRIGQYMLKIILREDVLNFGGCWLRFSWRTLEIYPISVSMELDSVEGLCFCLYISTVLDIEVLCF